MQGKPKGSIQPIEKTSLSTVNGIGPVVGEAAGFNLPNVDVVVTVGAPFEVPPMRWAVNEKVNKKQPN